MKRIHAFKAGTHTASDGTRHVIKQSDLVEICASFAQGNGGHDVPLVIGHPDINAPAYGWASEVSAETNDLYVTPRDVEASFSEAVNAKRYPKVSVSIWPRDHAKNPMPGRLTLRHVGFLGAMPPAVRGLQEASFADGEGCLDFAYQESWGWNSLASTMRNLRDWLIGKEGLEVAEKIIPNYRIDDAKAAEAAVISEDQKPEKAFNYSESEQPPSSEQEGGEPIAPPPGSAADLQAREDALVARERALQEREQAQSAAAAVAAIAKQTSEFADQLVASGQVLPRERVAVIELCMRVGGGSLDFAEGPPTIDLLKAFLSGREPVINFAEKSPTSSAPKAGLIEFSAGGAAVDDERLTVWAAAKAHQEEHGVSFDDALSAVLPQSK